MGEFWWATGIEDTFIAQTSQGRRRLDEYELLQHYQVWREDVDLVASVGFDSMRYGIPWYRVEPDPGRFDWRFTDMVIPYLVERGVEPIVDLVHYGTPLWLEREFANHDYPERVATYAAAFAERYRDLVRWYTPLNEPFINAELCGFTGRWPPYLRGDEGFTKLVLQLSRGIVLTQRALKAVRRDVVCVHVEAIGYGTTDDDELRERLALDMERMHAAIELVRGGISEGSMLHRYLAATGMSDTDLEWFRDNAIEVDVLGLNYYPFMSVWRRWTEDGAIRQEGVWGGGGALNTVVRDYHRRYARPIFITECSLNERAVEGTSFGVPPYPRGGPAGSRRVRWLDEAVETIANLRSEGLPVVGFCWWPLYDLVNWEYREGNAPVRRYLEPMGLFAIREAVDGTLRRERLPVAERMAEILAE
jgi:beta-glucosidase/6-phospho-beta-glucosidase/beta-galactosidase